MLRLGPTVDEHEQRVELCRMTECNPACPHERTDGVIATGILGVALPVEGPPYVSRLTAALVSALLITVMLLPVMRASRLNWMLSACAATLWLCSGVVALTSGT